MRKFLWPSQKSWTLNTFFNQIGQKMRLELVNSKSEFKNDPCIPYGLHNWPHTPLTRRQRGGIYWPNKWYLLLYHHEMKVYSSHCGEFFIIIIKIIEKFWIIYWIICWIIYWNEERTFSFFLLWNCRTGDLVHKYFIPKIWYWTEPNFEASKKLKHLK